MIRAESIRPGDYTPLAGAAATTGALEFAAVTPDRWPDLARLFERRSGAKHGCGEPVAWCSVAPRERYRELGGEAYPSGTNVWAVVCFFANRELRGRGVSARLLDAACSEAAASGADVIEGYPVAPDSPSYRFVRFPSTFLDAGFEEIGSAGIRRHVMRRRLRAAGTA